MASGEMNIGKACAIFKNINSDEYTVLEKRSAIRIVLKMATHNSITKADFLEVLRWMMEEDKK